ncbi:hypothetical protein DYBT9623_01282 [Dyadobacter sp. CECT 9623]|jgi:hypothetical protein|uniref:Polysaccharide lyase n=1 Tax=Dyadobacter linearis TaxID=2823330 RepID=A0ABM8UM65_9BACT|nr:polysaccharide lyase [Dyadobacter sp. CECT 9623]CAG5068551.1 hypothetical protein DYBT9623_01282 [Dyadobacter sp. CECT 9623]
MKKKSLLLLLFAVGFFGCSSPETGEVLPENANNETAAGHNAKTGDGGKGPLLSYYSFDNEMGDWYEKAICCSWSATVDRKVKRAGTGALKFELRRGDLPNGARTELGEAPNHNPEGWYAFSMYLPNTFVKDPIEESIVQWQSLPDFAAGEGWRSPPMLLGVLDDRFVLEIRSDANKVTIQDHFTFTRIDLGPVDKDKWLDWVFHVKWSHDNNGVVEVWRNSKLILKRENQPNFYNDEHFPYFKVGIYKWEWSNMARGANQIRSMYVDEIKIGSQSANYNTVAVSQDNALPVTLTSFTASKSGKLANLAWATAEESNSDYFVVQRSSDAKTWKEIGRKAASGQSKSKRNYTFTDQKPLSGAGYYRLKMVDRDQTFSYSAIKNVKF